MLQVASGAATARGLAAPGHTAVQLYGTMGIHSWGSRRANRFSKGDRGRHDAALLAKIDAVTDALEKGDTPAALTADG